MSDIITRYANLFNSGQDNWYGFDFGLASEPFVSDKNKLKYKKNPNHIKSLVDLNNFKRHLAANSGYSASNIDENGLIAFNNLLADNGKPFYEQIEIGNHKVFKGTDIGTILNPLNRQNKAAFAAIDVDIYDDQEELKRIVDLIYQGSLPLVPCYSKSGGLHIYLFTSILADYSQIDNAMKYFRQKLKIKAKEIFPKQMLTATKKWGNGIGLPYRSTVLFHSQDQMKPDFFINKNSLVKPDYSLGSITEFLDLAEKCKAIWTNEYWGKLPIAELEKTKDKKDNKAINQLIIENETNNVRPLSDTAAKIINNIQIGKEHEDGGKFHNWIVRLVYCCVVIDKRSDKEIKYYYDTHLKEIGTKPDDPDKYIEDLINDCRNKYGIENPADTINAVFKLIFDCARDEYYDPKKKRHYTPTSINQIYGAHFPKKETPTQTFYSNKNKLIADDVVYRPDLYDPNNIIINDNGSKFINTYTPSDLEPIEPTAADLKPFMDLVEYLIEDPKEREHFLCWLAYVVQNPGVKIRHAVIIYTKHMQVGKGSIFETMIDVLGENNAEPHEVRSILDKGVKFAQKVLVLIDETKSKGDFNERKNLINDLKRIITEQKIQQRVLYKDYGITKQFSNFLVFTNIPDALSIEATDPRYFVIENLKERLDQKFYDNYHKWRTDKGSNFVKYFLLHKDLSKFNPMQPPPQTRAKLNMATSGEDPLLVDIRTRFEEGEYPFPNNEAIRGTTEIKQWYRNFGNITLQKAAGDPKNIKRCFEALGFYELGQVKHKARDTKPSLWIYRNVENLKTIPAADLCNNHWRPLIMEASYHFHHNKEIIDTLESQGEQIKKFEEQFPHIQKFNELHNEK
jgi:hypothetical protein